MVKRECSIHLTWAWLAQYVDYDYDYEIILSKTVLSTFKNWSTFHCGVGVWVYASASLIPKKWVGGSVTEQQNFNLATK